MREWRGRRESVIAAPASAGISRSGVQRSPPIATVPATSSAANAKPILPPVEKYAIDVWLPWPAARAVRAASG
ncbi:hypothetical protein [Nocardia cyriacigeorgica]|uniref:hypothetical protein n=1 Tax=Nocardia cyriacigeorgica TaxID=135487 RepID=UPI0024552C1F|nr:hypothetical protein [Nocardia cyriacigeorgica]